MNTIDLSQLPAPEVVELLDVETILASMKADLISRDKSLADALQLESEPLVKLLEVCAYRELLLRQRINDASRSVMLAYATGSDLDHLAVLFGVERQCIDLGDDKAIPPILPTFESDDRLRRRIQLSHQRYSTAGSQGAYRFWALSVSTDVKAVDVQSPTPGVVVITILSNQDDGTASDALLNQVSQVLNTDDVRPLCDRVVVQNPHYLNTERGDTRYYPRDDVKAMIGHLNPVGSVIAYAGDKPPEGWLECDGVAVSRSVYADLFKIIGTIYGEGDRSTTFNLPDLRAHLVIGWDHGRGLDKKRKLGSTHSNGYHGYADDRDYTLRHVALTYCIKY